MVRTRFVTPKLFGTSRMYCKVFKAYPAAEMYQSTASGRVRSTLGEHFTRSPELCRSADKAAKSSTLSIIRENFRSRSAIHFASWPVPPGSACQSGSGRWRNDIRTPHLLVAEPPCPSRGGEAGKGLWPLVSAPSWGTGFWGDWTSTSVFDIILGRAPNGQPGAKTATFEDTGALGRPTETVTQRTQMTDPGEWKVLDLFSGAGGMSHGFHIHRRFSVIGAADHEVGKPGRGKSSGTSTYCNPTYKTNIGVTPLKVDLAIVPPEQLRDEFGLRTGELDVLVSCAPCTGFSQKNARNHLRDDPRNRLVERTFDFVNTMQPRVVVMENVKELLTGNQQHHFKRLRQNLCAAGYDVWADVHDLVTYGLPQRRHRAIVVACRDRQVAPLLPLHTSRPRTVRDAIAHLPRLQGGETDPQDPMHTAPRNTQRVLDRLRAIPQDGGSWADVMTNPTMSDERKKYLLIPAMFRARPGSFPDVYGRLWWDRPAVTITRECAHVGNGRYVHPEQDRLLSVREMALLQGFPSNYVFTGPLTAMYNQIGDAVPPLVSSVIARHIGTMLDENCNT